MRLLLYSIKIIMESILGMRKFPEDFVIRLFTTYCSKIVLSIYVCNLHAQTSKIKQYNF